VPKVKGLFLVISYSSLISKFCLNVQVRSMHL